MAKHKTTQWGATHEEWQKFIDLGLTDDLLPVVSNPEAEVSSGSTMKQLGKTPSIYNRDDKVRGIPKWTSKYSSDKEVARWSEKPVSSAKLLLEAR